MLDKITNDLALIFCIILTASCLLILHNKKRRYFIAYAISLLFIAAYQINSIVFKAEYPAYTISIVLYCISLAFFSIATLMHNKLPHSTLGIATVCLLFFAIIYANNLNFIAVIFTSFFFHLGYILCHLKSRSIRNKGDQLLVLNYAIYTGFLAYLLLKALIYSELTFDRAIYVFFANIYTMGLMAGLILIAFEQHLSVFRKEISTNSLSKLINEKELSEQFSEHLTEHNFEMLLISFHGLTQYASVRSFEQREKFIKSVANQLKTYQSMQIGSQSDEEFIIFIDTMVLETMTLRTLQQDINTLIENAKAHTLIGFHITQVSIPEIADNYKSAYQAAKLVELNSQQIQSVVAHKTLAELAYKDKTAQALKIAIDEESIDIFLQAKFDAKSHQITGAEALARWYHQDKYVPANIFIGLAEEKGLIADLDKLMFKKSLQFSALTRSVLGYQLPVSINYSTLSMHQLPLDTLVLQTVSEFDLDYSKVEIEITESAFADYQSLIKQVENIKHLGIRVAIDDFGTGYSNLGLLNQFPVDTLKIDRSIIQAIESDPHITSFVLQLARQLELKVTAEGIETIAQANWLKTRYCDELQGYLFAKPVSQNDFFKQEFMLERIQNQAPLAKLEN